MSYYISRNGQPQQGPYSEEDLQRMLSSGQLSPNDFAWKDGQAGWEPLHRLFPYFVGPAMMQPQALSPAGADSSLASRWSRLGAALLDGIIQLIAISPMAAGFGAFIDAIEKSSSETSDPTEFQIIELLLASTPQWALVAAGSLCLLLLVGTLYLLATRGQTLGKMICGIRIVRWDNGQNAGFVKAWLLRGFVPYLISNIPLVGGFFALVDVLFIFSPEKRCVHDLMAGTKVVRA